MDVHVVIATRNRALDVGRLLTTLTQQTCLAHSVTVVGTCEADVTGVRQHPYAEQHVLDVLISPSAGLCIQRNHGLQHVTAPYRDRHRREPFFVVFFDDDFRPAPDWLEACRATFEAQPEVAALTGCVLADGVHGTPIEEGLVPQYVSGQKQPEPHWATGAEQRELASMYGCNMAFRDRVVLACRFDENLPLYGWQEDRDYTSQAKAHGRTVYVPTCRGVHLGTKSGRVSGLRFGYSQIANPFYLWQKGTMTAEHGVRFVSRHLVSNTVRSLQPAPRNDYKGRLRGNLLALRDILHGSCHPGRIVHFG